MIGVHFCASSYLQSYVPAVMTTHAKIRPKRLRRVSSRANSTNNFIDYLVRSSVLLDIYVQIVVYTRYLAASLIYIFVHRPLCSL